MNHGEHAVKEFSEESIFNLARKLDAGAIREDYLCQACGDNAELRARVQALLDVHEQEKGFLASPAGVIATCEERRKEGVGRPAQRPGARRRQEWRCIRSAEHMDRIADSPPEDAEKKVSNNGSHRRLHNSGSMTHELRTGRRMGTAPLNGFLQRLRKAMAAETLSAFSDTELINRFLANHEEAAFQALVNRHGQMILRVCRRTLPDEQDVEDVFQATFLALASKARAIRDRESLASWLHSIAYHIALDACKSRKRRRKHETVAAVRNRTPALADDVAWKELRSVLDRELASLPERLSAPLVLCYLQGLTQDEAAARLGQSKSTFRRNLERGRELLGSRLARRGITLSAALFAPLLSECAAKAALPAALATFTTEAAVALAGGKAVAALASARALALAQGFVQPVLSAKVKCVCALLLGAALVGFGGAALPKEEPPVDPPPAERRQVAKNEAAVPPKAANVDEPKAAERFDFRFPWIATEERVQTELKLTIEQVRAIDASVGETYARHRKKIAPSGPIEPGLRLEGSNTAFPVNALRAKLSEILTDVQARRLRQLEIQVLGTSAFHDPANVKLLALTDEQQDKVRAITDKALQLQDGRTPLQRKNADIAAVRRILEILTDVQRKAWRDFAGEEFDFGWSRAPGTILSPGQPALPGSVPPK